MTASVAVAAFPAGANMRTISLSFIIIRICSLHTCSLLHYALVLRSYSMTEHCFNILKKSWFCTGRSAACKLGNFYMDGLKPSLNDTLRLRQRRHSPRQRGSKSLRLGNLKWC